MKRTLESDRKDLVSLGREQGRSAFGFLRIRVLNKTSLGRTLSSSSSPLTSRPLEAPSILFSLSDVDREVVSTGDVYLVHTIWFVVPTPPPSPWLLFPPCRRRRRRRRARSSSSSSSSTSSSSSAAIVEHGDREANRTDVHHCRRLRPGRHTVCVCALADEKNPEKNGAESPERRRERKEDRRTSRAVLSLYFTFRDLVSDDVYRGKWNRTRGN